MKKKIFFMFLIFLMLLSLASSEDILKEKTLHTSNRIFAKQSNIKIKSIADIYITVKHNQRYQLPSSVTAVMTNNTKQKVLITWNSNKVDTSKVRKLTFTGKVKNYNKSVKATINIVPVITKIDDIIQVALVGDNIEFPKKVKAIMSDGTTKYVDILYNYSLPSTNMPGIYYCDKGIVSGYDKFVKLKWVIRRYPNVYLNFLTERIKIDFLCPTYDYDNMKNLQYEPIDKSQIDRLKDIFSSEINKYPKSLLSENLDSIIFTKSLIYREVPIGGTFDSMNIYIADDNYLDADVKQVFHHEFNHILFNNYKYLFNEIEWTNCNPNDFKYGNGGLEFLKETIKQGKKDYDFDDELVKDGFINPYSQSGIEEDIAIIAQYLFTNNKRFWELINNNDRLKKKVSLLIDFYNKIDPIFKEEYFKNLQGDSI
ncbi:Bacterial Ig-like domain (group 4) [Caloramator mitchellensis]|uniref:Bacterial Ig-like domain (Group 4) n=1 Tax=Caloramator mitchellensis TaxID=908809 RepID=A0A0R3K4L8_CALMK|nr:putative zinc-binding metallopeptidase [Caloramator mitchellensis]KRQ87890.1 Bacterial Ig-like domain (group 4) [Caloramator mitchellensis]